jgi:hypothetical protein
LAINAFISLSQKGLFPMLDCLLMLESFFLKQL